MDESGEQHEERWSYDVFLSFRGEDVRKNFLSHLYESLVRSGIYAFKDDEELERGENISPKLLKAIENSKIHLVILSKNYASSSWCLDELLHIMECRKINLGHMVFPVFYDVEPSDVRKERGSFGETFDKHESRYPASKVQKWKAALTEITNLAGFVTGNWRSDADFIDRITREVLLRALRISLLTLPTYAVGIKSRVNQIRELMCFGSDDVRTVGICGMGGIGKTTLAKAAHNKFAHHFVGRCFLENFGECYKKPDGKAHLQRKLLSDILRRDDKVFINMDHAVKQRFRNKKVLVIVDDVEDAMQLKSVGVDLSCFGPGSRIIITSRNTHILKQVGVENIYAPNELDGGESLKLISWHAFKKWEPPLDFLELSKELVKYCGGLPLAMEVLGASLFDRSIREWKSTLKSLRRIPDDNVQAKLQISFDKLNTLQKDIFLDISCFFIGMDKDYVGYILNGCELEPDIGLSVLNERFLITVRGNRLMMHDLLRDMGRQIVRGNFPNNCGRWSRLWDRANVINVLTNHYYQGTDEIIGLSLKDEVTAAENLEVKAFSNLWRLRLLQLSNVSLNGSYECFPKGLRWLCWHGFPEESVPINLHLRSLVVMDMQNNNLKQLWNDQKPQILEELKYLDLSHSIQLTETPDFSYLPNLEKLLLVNCKSLVMVHKSIGILKRSMILLNLSGCSEIGELPLELYTLKSLETLILSGCSKLERLDDAVGELQSLTTFKADYTGVRQFPSTIGQLEKLKVLSLNGCTHSDESPQALPLSLNSLVCLKTLRLGSCNLSDELFPQNMGNLSCLEELDLQGNNFRNLQTDFAGLSSLHVLRLDDCSELQSMCNLPKRLRSFYASNCKKLERTPDMSECLALQSVHLTNCFSLVETPGLDKLKTVGLIHMEMCNGISDTYRETIMQGWAVGANGGIFIPGSSVPNWVSFRNEKDSISFTVPDSLNLVPVGFTLWTSYECKQTNVVSKYSPKITLKNQTKEDTWSRNPATDNIHMFRDKHIWQGHFSNEDFVFRTGDQVEVAVDFGDEVTILETGLTLAYKEERTEIPGARLTLIEEEVDDEPQCSSPVVERNVKRKKRKTRTNVKRKKKGKFDKRKPSYHNGSNFKQCPANNFFSSSFTVLAVLYVYYYCFSGWPLRPLIIPITNSLKIS